MTSTHLPVCYPETPSSPPKEGKPNEWYYSKSRREEAHNYTSESFSSEYMSEPEECDHETDLFDIESILADRVITKHLLDGRSGQMVETKVRQYQIVWADGTNQITWETDSKLRQDGCGDLIQEYLDRDEIKAFVPPSNAALSKADKEEMAFEAKHRSHTNPNKKKRFRERIKKEIENLVPFEDFFQVPCVNARRKASVSADRKRKSLSSSSSSPSSSSSSSEAEVEEDSVDMFSSYESSEEEPPRRQRSPKFTAQPLSITAGWKSSRDRIPSRKIRSPDQSV